MNSEDTTDLEATMTQSVKLKSSTCHSSTRAILCCVALSTASLIMGSSIVNRQKDSIFVPLSTPKDSRDLTVAPLTLKKRSHGEKKGSKYMQERRLKGPKVAWLMSFPNSGTSYTGQLVKEVTRETLATNYGSGNLNASGLSVPLYPDSVDGPFIADPKHKSLTMPQENEVVLTKTHCGGTCNQCHVTTYAISFETFLEKCLSGTKTLTIDGERQRENTRYSPEIVDRAIQVIRDPIDNIVSRYVKVFQFICLF